MIVDLGVQVSVVTFRRAGVLQLLVGTHKPVVWQPNESGDPGRR
jgi:hypothetical protein